jgi:hypothetical protein
VYPHNVSYEVWIDIINITYADILECVRIFVVVNDKLPVMQHFLGKDKVVPGLHYVLEQMLCYVF